MAFVIAMVLMRADKPQPTQEELVKAYLERCETAKSTAVKKIQEEIARIESDAKSEGSKRLAQASAELKRIEGEPASLLPIAVPPKAHDVGVLAPSGPAAELGRKSIDLLEALDEDDAIVRVWYVPTPACKGEKTVAETVTFLDVWLHGIDLRAKRPGDAIDARPVVIATGTKNLGTDCGSRSFVYLEIVDLPMASQLPSKKD